MFHANGNTIKIASSTASTNAAIISDGTSPDVMIGNNSTGWAQINFGGATIASTFPTTDASAPGDIIPPGMSMFFTPGTASTYISVALDTGTGALYVTPGKLT